MAYETKVILTILAERIANAESAKEAYAVIANAANVEGVKLPAFEEMKQKTKEKASD